VLAEMEQAPPSPIIADSPKPTPRGGPGPALATAAALSATAAAPAVASVFEGHQPAPPVAQNVFEEPRPTPAVSSNVFEDSRTSHAAAEDVFEEPSRTPAPHVDKAFDDQPQAAGTTVAEVAASAETKKRPTWKELAGVAATTPVEREPNVTPAVHARVRAVAGNPVVTPRRSKDPDPPRDDGKVFCDFDAKHRRIRDFRLPDLDGRPVRFKDLDADLVLIDFWGTWCQPCLRSVPHLVDLQKRFEGQKLQIVGIACEQTDGPERAAGVGKQVRRLGINYPILLSTTDGSCPLQKTLKVSAFPTMILVDREGRILWRDQGSTPVTLARLDRFLATSTRADNIRRY
jgi:thiol-disulfide isomerase/thioredoxin